MSRRTQRWPVWLVLLAATALEVLPLPDAFTPFRPPWATLALIYWIMMWPRLFGLGSAWIIGLILDILQGSLLGQHAMALLVVGYLTIRFHLQIRIFRIYRHYRQFNGRNPTFGLLRERVQVFRFQVQVTGIF